MTGALVGAGFFAQFHVEAWKRISGVDIPVVVDPDLARAREFASHWGIPRACSSLEELLGSERLDFVDLVTRPETHVQLTELAASHGVHVICQKPMAPTLAECREMVDRCEAHGVRLVIHENWRWQPWYREAKRVLDSSVLGTPFLISFRMRTGDGRGPEPYGLQPYFRRMPRLLLYETGIHFLDTFRYLFGEMESVFCSTERVNAAIRGEDCAFVKIRFLSGAHGLIDANRISGPSTPPVAFGELRIEGTGGLLRMDPDGRLWLTRYGSEERALTCHHPQEGYRGDSVYAMQRHFVDALVGGSPAESEGRVYLKSVAAIEACYNSASCGDRVDFV